MLALAFLRVAVSSEPVVVPFEELASGHVVVMATVDGHGPYRFVVDTGANAFVIDPRVARDELGIDLAKARQQRVHTADGKPVAIPMVVLRDVVLGDRLLTRAPSVATSLDPLLGESGVVGIVGRTMFGRDRLEVDFPRRELSISDSANDDDALELVRLRGGLTGVEVRGLTIVVDLGADISVLNSAGARLLGVVPAPAIDGIASGLGGAIDTSTWVALPPIDLGDPTPGGPVPVVDLALFDSLRLGEEPALLLGVDQMRGRVLTIDYGAKQVSLRTR